MTGRDPFVDLELVRRALAEQTTLLIELAPVVRAAIAWREALDNEQDVPLMDAVDALSPETRARLRAPPP